MSAYIPDRGDIVWLDFTPQQGHAQAGKRPAIVISPQAYNKKTGLGLFCPITSQVKGYPFEVLMPQDQEIKGVILSDQLKSLDWASRRVCYIFKIQPHIIEEVVAKISVLLK